MIEEDRYFKAREVAAYLGVHINTVKRLINSGTLRGIRVGSRGDYRVSETELKSFIRRNQV